MATPLRRSSTAGLGLRATASPAASPGATGRYTCFGFNSKYQDSIPPCFFTSQSQHRPAIHGRDTSSLHGRFSQHHVHGKSNTIISGDSCGMQPAVLI